MTKEQQGAKPNGGALMKELLSKYPPILTQRQVSEITGRAGSTLEQDRIYGGGIPFIRLGRKSIRYRLDDVVTYLESLPRFTSTTEADAARAAME